MSKLGAFNAALAGAAPADGAAIFIAPTATGDITLNRLTGGPTQKVALTGATQARVFLPPTGGVEGQHLTVRLLNDIDGDPARTLAFDPLIIKPSLSISTWPHPLVEDGIYKIKLEYFDGRWELLAFVGAY